MPNEAVDPFSGTLSIVETDLVLPGNAGLDVRVQRVYSSAIYPGYQSNDFTIEEDSWAGIGWKLHFGRVIHPDASVGGETQIEMGDGSRHALYTTTAFPEGWISKSFWRYDRSTHTLKLPNGIVYEFGHAADLGGMLGTVRYVTLIRDPFNNRIEFSYAAAPGPADGVSQIRQMLGAGQVREINFVYDTAGMNAISLMTYGGRTWRYHHAPAGPPGHSVLVRVEPPAGPATHYEYHTGHELRVLRAPGGGTVTYAYADVIQPAGPVTIRTRGVVQKTLGGRDVTPGSWTYAYATGANHDTTRVSCPCGTTTHRFNGVGLYGNFSGWLAGSLAERRVEDQGVLLEREQLTWIPSEVISSDPTVGTDGIWTDAGVFTPLLQSSVVTRGPQSWTTTFSYHSGEGTFNDYGHPWRINEDGELRRSVTWTFQYGFAPYIVGRVRSRVVRVGAEEIQSWWAYDLASGFLKSHSPGAEGNNWPKFRFEPSPEGNVFETFDPRGNRTAMLYAWGRVRDLHTPATRTRFTVSPDGSIAAEDNLVDIPTSYQYDLAGRPTAISALGLASIGYDYHSSAQWVTVGRDPSWTRSYLDGFGRVTRTVNSVGLQTRVGRDACGRTTFTSHPYTSGEGTRGVSTSYDALGRVRATVDGDGTTQYAYTGIDVTVTDPNHRQTAYDYGGFGGPGDTLLLRVTDAAGQRTDYSYNIAGKLIRVAGPNATPARTWTYDWTGVVLSETQPESGTATYQYDLAGNRTHATHAGATTVFTYDIANRLVLQDAPGTGDDIAYEYDTVGRLKRLAIPNLTSPTASTTYQYDAVGRLVQRQDVVNGQSYHSRYEYDPTDRLTRLTYPSGRAIGYEYDSGGRPLVVRNNGAVFASGFTYTDAGQLASYTTGAVTHTLSYDARERVRRLTAATALDLTYGYDAASQVTGITDARPGMSQAFGYDALGRLTTGTGPWGQATWTYDPAGNRLTEMRGALTTFWYDPMQRLVYTNGSANETFSYDARGRLISDSQGQYLYNNRGLLATVLKPSLTATYAYDASGLRVTSTINADTTTTIRGAGGELLSEYRTVCGTSVWARDAVYAAGRLLGSVRANTATPTVALTATTATVPETQTEHTVGVRLTTATGAPTPCPVSVVYQTVPGSASAGADFWPASGTLLFPAGTLSGTVRPISVALWPDTLDEVDEHLALTLATVSGGSVSGPASYTITITDDDATPALTISDVMLAEGHSGTQAATFTVTLTPASGRDVQVSYYTANDTAAVGIDYLAAWGTLTFPPGTTSATLTVSVVGDSVYEPTERLAVNLYDLQHALPADAQGFGTIVNDDVPRKTWGDVVVPLDGKADGALFSWTTGLWTFRDSQTGVTQTFGPWGGWGDVPVPQDYDGDGRTDCAVYRPSEGAWYSAPACGHGGAGWGLLWGGIAGDIAAPADFDGDGIMDITIYRNQPHAIWYVRLSATNTTWSVAWGQPWTTSIPVPGDYDGDGRADATFYTAFNGTWWILRSTTGATSLIDWGIPGQTVIPVPADYDGDRRMDLAFFYPANGHWYIVPSTTGVGYAVGYGTAAMTPVPADYDGDGKADIAQYDPDGRVFWVRQSTSGASVPIVMGDVSAPGDLPILKRPR